MENKTVDTYDVELENKRLTGEDIDMLNDSKYEDDEDDETTINPED